MGACRGYKDINMLAIQLLNPGGVLLTTRPRLMSSTIYSENHRRRAIDAGRDVYNLKNSSVRLPTT